MIERTIELETPDGRMPTFVTYPEAPGPHPAVIFYMDAPGIREELYDMCRRLGTVGYYVLLPNVYYRWGGPSFPARKSQDEPQNPEVRKLVQSWNKSMMQMDTAAVMAHVEQDPAADETSMGAVGTCMGGPPVVNAAADYPERVRAFATWHGSRMVTDEPDSPHLAAGTIKGEGYFAWSPKDETAPEDTIPDLQEALRKHGIQHRVELHPDAPHGYTFPTRWCYEKDAAERTWERLFELFERQLPRRNE